MGLFRIFPLKDTTITNAHVPNDLAVRGTGSNFGADPSLEVFARKAEISSGSIELSRALLRFNVTELSGKIYTDKVIPSSSVSYFLKMFNMQHDETVPTSYDLFVYPLSQSWDEGTGLNMNFWSDGYANWLSASSTQTWTTTGSDFLTTNYGSGSQHFDRGSEDLEVNITDVIINWLTGTLPENGIVVKMGNTEETNGVSYFRKAFHSRESKFIDRLPYVEARWNDVIKDNRNNLAYDQNNKLYMYNFIRGVLTNVTEPVYVRIQDHVVGISASFSSTITASFVSVGTYSASLNVKHTASFSSSWYDIWHSGSYAYMTGTFIPRSLTGSATGDHDELVVNISNLKRKYSTSEKARLNALVTKRNRKTHIGVVATGSLNIQKEMMDTMYYSIINYETGETVIPFATGSVPHTQLSYDNSGNYFEVYMNSFVPGFMYEVLFLIKENGEDKLVQGDFKFKVVS